jgi:uncharacterized protein YbjT (DUF2867 family)
MNAQPDPLTTTSPEAPILVVGSNGTVGREVVPALLARGARVRILVRDPARSLGWPSDVEVVTGDLRDGQSVRAALTGARSAFYVSPHEADEERLAANFVAACEESGVRLVFAGVHLVASNLVIAAVRRTMFTLLMPWYAGKLAVAHGIERSATRPVLLVPSNFMQNDDTFADEIRDGRFVTPLSSRGVNRVDLRDVAEVAARALTEDGFPSGSYLIAGPQSLSGAECARIWSDQLGRPVVYTGDDDAAFQAALDHHLAGKKMEDWGRSFRLLRRLPVHARPEEIAITTRLLGHAPRGYSSFVAERAAAWAGVSR